ncbi:MAG TPA: FAD-dependent oxidoreductase [Chthonomonadaceae bacterium]|nr:FAD-dependent oxidoreductase [Chthonomonadaceae bacterium]
MVRTILLLCCLLCCPLPLLAQTVSPPRSFEAIALSSTEIRLYWLPAQGATGYRIERDGQTVASLPPATQEWADTGLLPASTHRYTLRALQGEAASSERSYMERTFAPFPTATSKKGLPIQSFDVVVVQASSGGVAAAIEAARRGLRVALVEPTTRLGGMPVNGLSATDLRGEEHAAGIFVRFRNRVRDIYAAEGITTNGLKYEPLVAHQAMKSLVYEVAGITVYRRVRPVKVITTPDENEEASRRVSAILVEELGADGKPTGRRAEMRGKVFVDATDCGDIAAWAGAEFRLGREPRSAANPHDGVIYYDRANDKLLPGSTGKGDRRIQSYTYLLTVKDYGPNADKTLPKPPGYRREDFIHSPPWKISWAVSSGTMPGSKFELNQHPEGGDLQGINYRYPTSGYQERERVEALYRNRVLCYLYYLQTEPQFYCEDCKKWLTPADYAQHPRDHKIRTEPGQKQLGLPDDEYRDTGGFPPLLYVREGRRIVGEQTPSERDITQARKLTRPESIGLGDYPMDSHAVRPKTDFSTPDMGEGEWWLYQYTPWYELPLGIIVPKHLDNVFVTTAVSSTHVSFGTFRLEPVRMAFGEAAGIGADLCLRFHLTARNVPARQIQDEMLAHLSNPEGDPNTVLTYFPDLKPGSRHYAAIQYLTTRGIRLPGENFRPDAPTTRGEFAKLMNLLAERANPDAEVIGAEGSSAKSEPPSLLVRQEFAPYMGEGINREKLKELQHAANPDANLSRLEIAEWLVAILPGRNPHLTFGRHYSDLSKPDSRAPAEILYDMSIDSSQWDGWNAYAPDGSIRFRPDAPLRHDDLFQALYIMQIGFGPLFYDHPSDGKNGRSVPPALFETVRKPWAD